MVCPWSPYRLVMTGSLRQRGPDTWELRVYLGVDHDSGRERWATKTVHGSRRHATARLGEFVEDAGYARLRAGTVADLLDRWMATRVAGVVVDHTGADPQHRRASSQTAARRHQGQQADDDRHRRHVPLLVALRRARRSAADGGHGAPRPRRVASSLDPGGPLGVDLAQPGSQLEPTSGHPYRDPPSDTRPDSTPCRIGRRDRPRLRHLSVVGGLDRGATKPDARFAMGRHRLHPLSDRVQPRLRRRARRASAARHEDPPHLPRRRRRGQHATTRRSLPAIDPTSHRSTNIG